jgi:exodeoxyribonuclease VII large subunit
VDFTIADFVADVRAATPSNAAEIVVDRSDNFQTRMERADHRLAASMRLTLSRRRERADRLDSTLRRWPAGIVLRDRDQREADFRLRRAIGRRASRAAERFEALRRRLERRDVRRVTSELATRLAGADVRLRALAMARRQAAEARARELAARLHALSPLAVLGRGYAVCWNDEKTSIIRSEQAVRAGDAVRVTLADGELRCRVEPDR